MYIHVFVGGRISDRLRGLYVFYISTHTHTHAHALTHANIYIYIYIYIDR